MDILIKGMKKPTACYKCPLRTGKYCGILTENEKCAEDGVLPHCPIVEIPSHGRLIDADRLSIQRENYDTYNDYSEAFDMIDNAPTVVEEQENH